MRNKAVVILFAALAAGFGGAAARADDERDAPRLPQDATFTTLVVTPLAIEGLTGDAAGNLYTTGRAASPAPCPVWKINIARPSLVEVGFIPNPAACNPSGIAFDEAGNLYIADAAGAGTVWTLAPNESRPPLASGFATGVPGTNGIAFDRHGNLWTGDGTTGQGRIWKIASSGGACEPAFKGCVEAFRIQPMRNGADLGGDLAGRGVGRENRTVPPENAQNLVANGLAFDHEGDLYIADTARGAIWKAQLDRRGNLKSAVNCDTTFTANTLCLDSVFVSHPYLEGTDGIAFDRAGNLWNSANERNAVLVVSKQGQVSEAFRNPANAAGLRNSADAALGDDHILEFPASPVLLGRTFCTSNSDGNRGKISCMDQELIIRGMRLPAR